MLIDFCYVLAPENLSENFYNEECVSSDVNCNSSELNPLKNELETNTETTFNCGVCDRKFKKNHFLKKHLDLVHLPQKKKENKNEISLCDLCGFSGSKRSLENHFVRSCELNRKFICGFCKQRFQRKSYLREHLPVHGDNCVDWQIFFLFLEIFDYTETNKLRVPFTPTNKLMEQRKFKCKSCPWRFNTKRTLDDHILQIHTSKFFFFSLQQLRLSGDYLSAFTDLRPFKCEICNKSYKLINALTDHKHSVHIEERRHACTKCDKKFKLPHHLKEHNLRVHERPQERKFICDLCKKKFLNQLDLKVHEKRSHGGKAD